MRILHINKFAYRKGGAEEYMLRTAERQANSGDTVAVFGYGNQEFPNEIGVEHFDVKVSDFHEVRGIGKLGAASGVLWSSHSKASLRQAMRTFAPDVVHLHNYAHQLSPSIISEIRSSGVGSVYTAHDYKLVCPAYVANVRDEDCFACAHKLSKKLLIDRCHHDDLAWSALAGVEAAFVRTSGLVPDRIIAPSEFMHHALTDSWLHNGPRISLVRNPVEATGHLWSGKGDFLLYAGRLSREKGVEALIQATAELNIALVVAGDGPLRDSLETLALSLSADVKFTGHIGAVALSTLRTNCIAQVMSSQWPENAPLSALEAAADGVPLIVTRRGGLPELRTIGARVAVVSDVSSNELSRALRELERTSGDPSTFERETSWATHLSLLSGVYQEVLR